MPKDCVSPSDENRDAFASPISVMDDTGRNVASLKIDTVFRQGAAVLVVGWCSDPAMDITAGDGLASLQHRLVRPDVAASLGQSGTLSFGFCLLVIPKQPDLFNITVADTQVPIAIPRESTDAPVSEPVPEPVVAALFACMARGRIGGKLWRAALGFMPDTPMPSGLVAGKLDHAVGSRVGTVVGGWCVQNRRTQVWLEDADGRAYALQNALDIPSPKVGFIADLSVPGPHVTLCGVSHKGRFTMSHADTQFAGGDLKAVAARLHDVPSPRTEISRRAALVDLPHLNRLRGHLDANRHVPDLIVTDYGAVPKAPRISVIVPLYGRIDFIEHQLLAFVNDPDFQDAVELIYVLDDPNRLSAIQGHAPLWLKICGCPFKVVHNGQNNGFSGACNIGAEVARGETLIFLNSDVFPQAPGWASGLGTVLANHDTVGIVAPRLLFPDGGLQHAGMVPYWRPALEIWSNRHQYMGFDPALDPAQELTQVPLVTGACVALRRRDFDAVGGWNTDYLLGDFEDSDLCLSLQDLGLHTAYEPRISLTHIERQSVSEMGEPTFRSYVTLLNATRYSRRWGRVLKGYAQ